jgi:hypothetical protein
MTKGTGGPAFPYVCDADFDYGTGMTLRDYFAAKAMQTIIGGKTASQLLEGGYMATAMSAYGMADAMLKAREQ